MQAKKYDAALKAFDQATYITIKNATVWNNKGVALVALGKPSDALECFKKALGIDPKYAEAAANKEDAMGRQQSFNISGTITPKVTVSRIGTLYTTITPAAGQATAVITQEPQIGDTMPIITTMPVAKKTTYSPVSPLTVLGALAVVAGVVAAMRRK
jgi:tetratricopeptide (TPR) repeat protein